MRLTSSGATAWRHLSGFWLVMILLVMLAKHIFGVICFVFYYSNSTFFSIFLFYVTCQCALKLGLLFCISQLI